MDSTMENSFFRELVSTKQMLSRFCLEENRQKQFKLRFNHSMIVLQSVKQGDRIAHILLSI